MSQRQFLVHCGRAEDVVPTLPEQSFDACLCDPPYHLTQASRKGSPRQNDPDTPFGRTRLGDRGFMGQTWDGGDVAFRVETWSAVYRVLKPGAFLLAFGGTRTYHRLACAIEDAGFEIRDCLMWLYGSGFPKSFDISKAIDKAAGAERQVVGTAKGKGGENLNRIARIGGNDSTDAKGCGAYGQGAKQVDIEIPITAPATAEAAQWQGYGTALKPAWEPILVAMKPCDGTFAENALEHGVAGLNLDHCRIGYEGTENPATNPLYRVQNGYRTQVGSDAAGSAWTIKPEGGNVTANPKGRWPANVILDEESAAMLDEQSGWLVSGNNPAKRSADKHQNVYAGWKGEQCLVRRGTDAGTASRFFYVAKADSDERTLKGMKSERIKHPTMKPVDLTAYLAKLILPPKRETPRRILVPFSGSGSEVISALRAGWDDATGIEQDPEWVQTSTLRINGDAPLFNCEV